MPRLRFLRLLVLLAIGATLVACAIASPTPPPSPPSAYGFRANCVIDVTFDGAVEGRAAYWGIGHFHDLLGFNTFMSVDSSDPPRTIFVQATADLRISTIGVASGLTIFDHFTQPPLVGAEEFHADESSTIDLDPAAGLAVLHLDATSTSGSALSIDGTATCDGPLVDASTVPT